jgi:hypothetical protein
MPQGLQVWDAGGNLVLDITDSITRVVAVIDVAAGASGTYQLPEGRPFWYSCNNTFSAASSSYAPAVSVNSSNLLSYSAGGSLPGTAADNCKLMVGVY